MMGVLLAMQVVMSRLFNVQLSDSLRVNLGFLPNAVAGMLMGPFCGMLVAGRLRRPAGGNLVSLGRGVPRRLHPHRRPWPG